MRYIGGKEKLLSFIDSVINENKIKAQSFADIFSGTSVVRQAKNQVSTFSWIITYHCVYTKGFPVQLSLNFFSYGI